MFLKESLDNYKIQIKFVRNKYMKEQLQCNQLGLYRKETTPTKKPARSGSKKDWRNILYQFVRLISDAWIARMGGLW